ncbi:MAG: response regulator [Alphaproteobacteria bacterium]|nr:response regulator [Alphaproteobacteria bacterium]
MRKRILIIEDDADVRDLVARYCTRLGYTPALMAESRFFDVGLDIGPLDDLAAVITDIFMPGKSGIQIIREIRSRSEMVKIIAMSGGWSTQGSREDALQAAGVLGVDAALPKPFTMEEFRSCLKDIGLPAS